MATIALEHAAEAEAAAEALFFTTEGRTDPYPLYHRIREAAPVHRSESVRAWLLTRYSDVHAVLRDPRFEKAFETSMDARKPSWRDHSVFRRGARSMLNLDGPAHTRLRRLVVQSFTPRTVDRLRPRIQAMVDELSDGLADTEGGDLIAALAFPLPVNVIGELLGVPEADRAPFRQWVAAIVGSFEARVSPEELEAADAATDAVDSYFHDLIAEKRRHPGDDLLSNLLVRDAGEEGDGLDDEELVTLAGLLFGAGFETTTNLVGNGMLGLLRHPDQVARLREDPGLVGRLPDELLRYDGTVQVVARVATEDVEIGGRVVPGGAPVFAVVGAANRDPAQFEHPDELDVARADVRPLTFGGGVHFCLGAALARAEVEIVFATLLHRFGEIELAVDRPAFRDRLILRGLDSLPLRLVPATSTGGGAAPTRTTGREADVTPVPPSTAFEVAESGALPLRPGGSGDLAWREAFRRRLEQTRSPKDAAVVRAVADLFGRTPFLAGCTRAELEQLAATSYAIDFEVGDVLVAAGDDASEAYVIAEGEAEVQRDGAVVATIAADDLVGERGPVEGAPRNATVVARTRMVTYAISRERLVTLLASSPAAADSFAAAMRSRYGG